MRGGKSKIGSVEGILMEEGTEKQVWGDSDGEPNRELPEENVEQVRRWSPGDREIA